MSGEPPNRGAPAPEEESSFSAGFRALQEHLEELRGRVFRIGLILAAGTVAGFFLSDYLLNFLSARFTGTEHSPLALLYPTEGFVVRMKAALVAALFFTSPLWFWQVWRFLAPALYPQEKKAVLSVVAASSLMFLLGAAFGYWILVYAVQYFLSQTPAGVSVGWSMERFIDFNLQLLLAFGLIFELPLVIFAAARLGIVQPRQLRKYRRHAYVVILIVAAILTPPDVFTQLALAAPLIILYEIGIFMASVGRRRTGAERTGGASL